MPLNISLFLWFSIFSLVRRNYWQLGCPSPVELSERNATPVLNTGFSSRISQLASSRRVFWDNPNTGDAARSLAVEVCMFSSHSLTHSLSHSLSHSLTHSIHLSLSLSPRRLQMSIWNNDYAPHSDPVALGTHLGHIDAAERASTTPKPNHPWSRTKLSSLMERESN